MKILNIKDSIEYEHNEYEHRIQLPPFLSQFIIFFKIGYSIGIVPFKLLVDPKSGFIALHSTLISKVNIPPQI